MELFKYGLVSVLGYGMVIGGNYLLVEFLHIAPPVAYIIVLSVTYICMYIINLKFVFKKEHSRKSVISFLAFILVFWILNNILFNIFYRAGIHYIYAACINIVAFSLLRFFTLKKIVFE